MKRREWIKMMGGGVLAGGAGCSFGGGGAGKHGWSRSQLEAAGGIARANGCKAWGAWESGRLKESWRTHERGGALSITKALAGLACAKAAEEGWLSPGERVANTITEWSGDSGKEAVTVRMLLQQVAGIEGGAGALYRKPIADKGKVAVRLRQLDPPETIFRYGPAGWEILAELLQRKAVARGERLESFLQRGVMRPIGLSSPDWRSDGKGRFYLSTGAELSVTDLGRLGRTIGDLLAGRDAIGIRAAGFSSMTRPSRVNPMFGGGFWWNRNGSRGREVEIEEVLDPPKGRSFWGSACISKRQPSSMVSLVGSSGQRVFVWPESRQVVARLGYSGAWRDRPFLAAL